MIKIVVPMAIGIFLAAMDGTIVVSSYAAIGSELNQLQSTSWIATGYMLTLTSFQPLYGKMSDIFGRKSCLLFAYSIFALGCLLCGLARNMNELIAARAFAGIGGGGMTTVVSIIMSDIVPLRSRGTWQGVLNIVFATGSAAGAPLGGFLADSIGWRWAFLVQVPMTLLAITSVSLALDLPKVEFSDFHVKLRRVDFPGAITLVLAVFFLLFGLDRGGNIAWDDKLTVASLSAFGALCLLFWTIEMEIAKEPFAPRRIIVNRSLIASYLVNFFGMASGLSLLFHISLWLQAVQGKSASAAGVWLLWSIGGSVTGSLGGGLIMQATGKYYYLTLGAYVALFGGSLLITLMTGLITTSFTGLAIGSGITTSLIALIANAGPKDQAIATAVSYLFRSLGSVVGLSVGSSLVQGTLRSALRKKLDGTNIEELIRRVRESLTYVDTLDPGTQAAVRSSYAQAVLVTLLFTTSMGALAAISAIFIKEKPLTRSPPN
ncbi:member of the major facilitator superfamily [Pleurotus eryngii]|uniref:Member of the major facilitator superfamily n=1 Tax=Pleurotus eryngii TaxID=5323 RepID=A0A9P5ZQF8_PLEER|nr:member of the major facilitator superfamily [Pleurotus eryngii]